MGLKLKKEDVLDAFDPKAFAMLGKGNSVDNKFQKPNLIAGLTGKTDPSQTRS